MHKRGLSDVVTTVLVILVALAAVVILWNFLRPFLNTMGIDTQQLTTQVSVPESSVSVDPNTNLAYLRVDRQAGDGEVVGFIVGLQDPSGLVKTFRQNLTVNQLETKNLVVNYTDAAFDDVLSVTVTPIFRNNATGTEVIGQPITQTVKNKTAYRLPSGLVAQWKFDESWGDSKNDLGGAPQVGSNPNLYPNFNSQSKKIGSASGNFSGSNLDYVIVSHNALLNPSEFTIVVWVNLTLTPTPTFSEVFYKSGYYLQYNKGTGNWEFITACPSRQINQIAISRGGAGSWEFLAATYKDGANINIYNNQNTPGAQIPTCTYSPSTQPLLIGRSFNGAVDELMVYNRILTSQEINDIRTKYKG